MYQRGDKSHLRGTVKQLSDWVCESNHTQLMSYINELLLGERWCIEHPLHAGVQLRCRASLRIRFANVLFFNSSDLQHPVAIIQTGDFVNGLLIGDVVYQLHANQFGHRAVESVAFDLLRNNEFSQYYRLDSRFGGVLVSHQRPAHFFYDQMVNLPFLSASEGKVVARDNHCFFPLEHLTELATVKASPEDFYIFPSTLAGGAGRSLPMEALILESAKPAPIAPDAFDFRLWIAVADEKRCWLDQVNGYAALICELARHFPKLAVVVDGFTAFHGEQLSVPGDEAIMAEIAKNIPGDVELFSVVGSDYATKLSYATAVDGFVSYVGTQSMVPLNFAKCKGVLHSNTIYGASQSYSDVEGIVKVPIDEVTDRPSRVSGKSDFRSYFFHWQLVFNGLIEALKLPLDKLDIPVRLSLEDLPEEPLTSADIIAQYAGRIANFKHAADYLSELSRLFSEVDEQYVAGRLQMESIVQSAQDDQFDLKFQLDGNMIDRSGSYLKESPSIIAHDDVFSELPERFSPYHQTPDFLREIAIIFESLEDWAVAERLMTYAVSLRPKGRVLVDKLKLYRKALESKQ